MSETEDFETRLEKAKAILDRLMDPSVTLEESVKAYAEGMAELQAAQEMLEKAQLQIEQIRQAHGANAPDAGNGQ